MLLVFIVFYLFMLLRPAYVSCCVFMLSSLTVSCLWVVMHIRCLFHMQCRVYVNSYFGTVANLAQTVLSKFHS